MYYQVAGDVGCAPQLIRAELLESRVTDWAVLIVAGLGDVGDHSGLLGADQTFTNFGVIAPSENKHVQFRIKNVCSESIEILSPVVSCSCVRARFDRSEPITLSPGGEVSLEADVAIGAGNFRQAIVLTARGIGSHVVGDTLRLDLLSSQLQVLQYSPKDLDFGEILPNAASRIRTVTLREVSSDRFRIMSVDCGELPLSCEILVSRQTGSNMSSYDLSFCCARDQPGQGSEFSGEIIVLTTSARMPKIRIPVKGQRVLK